MQWRLIAFDFDGSITEDEMIVELATARSTVEEVRAITDRAMRGELEYGESLRSRVALVGGLDERDAIAAMDSIDLLLNVDTTIDALRAAGVHVAILTGGFRRGVERLLERKGIEVDTVIANELEVDDGRLSGRVTGPLVDTPKDVVLEGLVDSLGLTADQVVAVGDGANDIPMLRYAGLAVGFRPKPAVRPYCDVEIDTLAEVLEHLGIA